MSIRTIAYHNIEPGHEQESAPHFQQLWVLEEARRRPDFPGGELPRAIDCAWRSSSRARPALSRRPALASPPGCVGRRRDQERSTQI